MDAKEPVIRVATQADIPGIVDLLWESWQTFYAKVDPFFSMPERRDFLLRWRTAEHERAERDPRAVFVVAVRSTGGDILGYSGAGPVLWDEEEHEGLAELLEVPKHADEREMMLELYMLFVHPSTTGTGLAPSLMAAALGEALVRQPPLRLDGNICRGSRRAVLTTSRELNARACTFYERKMGGGWAGDFGDLRIPQENGQEPKCIRMGAFVWDDVRTSLEEWRSRRR